MAPTTFAIRRLRADDPREVAAVARIHESVPAAWEARHEVNAFALAERIVEISGSARDARKALFVAEDARGLVGFHWLELERERREREGGRGQTGARIVSLWVREDARRQGLGRALKRAGENWARERGAAYVRTTVHASNRAMLALNAREGFEAGMVEMTKRL